MVSYDKAVRGTAAPVPVSGQYAMASIPSSNMKVAGIFITTFILLVGYASQACADKAEKPLPKWEFGVAAGAVSLPQYMGSDERYILGAPLPYIIYRGDRINIDRNGLRTRLFDISRVTLDASISGGLPVRSSNMARHGMPELHFNLQAGPRINWKIIENRRTRLTLRIPYRAIMDSTGDYLGWVLEPDIALHKTFYNGRKSTDIKFSAGILYGSKQYHDTYYGVPAAFATPSRPVYQAKRGLHSISVSGSIAYDLTDHFTLFSAVKYRNLSPGVIANSPLVKDHDYLSIAIGMTWSIFQSESYATDQ